MSAITPTTDLAPFQGARVCIAEFRFAVIEDIRHGADARPGSGLAGGVWGAMFEESRADLPYGNNTAFHFVYGTDFTLAPDRLRSAS